MSSKWGSNWWIGAVIILLIIGLIVRIIGARRPFIPEREEFMRIRAIPYDVENMNCTHKASMYVEWLRERGWRCWTALGSVSGIEAEHAWVIVLDKKNGRRLCDPTNPIGGASGYPERSYEQYDPRIYVEDE